MSAPRRTLIVTNDFPPRQGGIQSFVHELALRQPPGSVVVYASDHPGSAAFDAGLPFPVLRHPSGLLLPGPGAWRAVTRAVREFECGAVWFGAAAPLGLLGAAVRDAGARRVVATTHGHEAGWAMLPGARAVLRRIGEHVDVVTVLGGYFRDRLTAAFGPHPRITNLRPGVDVETFRPDVDGSAVRARHRLDAGSVIVCVSRLVPRKGQDRLIAAMPVVRTAIPGARLLLVGDGPYRPWLQDLAARLGVRDAVTFAGSVDAADLPAHYAAGDVFAMPCRTRRGGMDVEGLGIVFLEAAATGLPVVAGRSGGAPDAVRDGETGVVVDGEDVEGLSAALITLLRDPALRRRMGAAGRAWVQAQWQWDASAARLREILDG